MPGIVFLSVVLSCSYLIGPILAVPSAHGHFGLAHFSVGAGVIEVVVDWPVVATKASHQRPLRQMESRAAVVGKKCLQQVGFTGLCKLFYHIRDNRFGYLRLSADHVAVTVDFDS